MFRIVRSFVISVLLATGLLLTVNGGASAQCVGDCNGNGAVTAGEVTRITAVILNCSSTAAGCAAVPGGCLAADRNSNGIISAGELTFIINNVLLFANGCPPRATATFSPTSGVTPPTDTPVPPPTATATATETPVTPSATPTTPPAGGTCGQTMDGKCCNNTVDAGEECDNGGTCVGGTNTGNACTGAAGCPGGYCQAFGADGCANNCTNETTVRFEFSGLRCFGGAKVGNTCTGIRTCVGGPFPGKPCLATVAADCGPSAATRGVCASECATLSGTPPVSDGGDCFGVGECTAGDAAKIGTNCPSSTAANIPPVVVRQCQSGSLIGRPCTSDTQCTGGGTGSCGNPCSPGGTTGSCRHRSGSVLQSIGLVGALNIGPFTGGQDLVVGKPGPDGLVPVAVPAASVLFAPVKVPGLACACPSGSPAADVHGPNNSGSGLVACGAAGLPNVNVDISRDHNTTPGSPSNGPGSCVGGSRSGLVCAFDADCPGSTCVNALQGGGMCVGGSNKGKVCKAETDCPGSLCASPDDPTCSAQEPPPPLGSGTAACTEANEICTGGTMIGAPCTNNAECGVSGVCGTVCNTGSLHAGMCNGPTRLSFSGTGAMGSGIVVANIAIGVIATPNDDGTCRKAAVCTTFTFNQTAAPTVCQVNSECGAGKTCSAAYCAGTCTAGGTIGRACIRTSDCGAGGFCNQGTKFSQTCSGIPGECGENSVCQAVVAAKGFDGLPCTDDDPVSSQGTPQNLPTTTGTASGAVIDATDILNVPGKLIAGDACTGRTPAQGCVTSRTGKPFNCATLLAASPSITGASVASAFNQLDATTIGDDVITVGQTAK